MRGRSVLRAVYFLPAIVSTFAVGKIWTMLFDPIGGPLRPMFAAVGLNTLAEVRWIADPKLALMTVILVNIWQWSGWNMVVYLAGLQSVPRHLYESAAIDGAGRMRVFWSITLPHLAGAFTVNVIMTTVGAIKVFDLPFALTGGGPGYSSQTLMMSVVRNSFALSKFGYGAAMSLVVFTMTFVVAAVQLRSLSDVERRLT